MISQSRLSIRIAGDDLLGLLYRMEEHRLAGAAGQAPSMVAQRLGLGRWLTWLSLQSLRRRDLIGQDGDTFRLTDVGRAKARTLVRSHRLWESYLQKHFALPQDHLHAAAHRVEHYLDEGLRAELDSELDSPTLDPHGTEIPDSGKTKAGKKGAEEQRSRGAEGE
jgi:Mn-dependent DtxR family transcriptional regulator